MTRFFRFLFMAVCLCVLPRLLPAQVTLRNGMSYVGAYSGSSTYAKGDTVSSSGIFYVSLVGSNIGNTPASSPTQWGTLGSSGGSSVPSPFSYTLTISGGTITAYNNTAGTTATTGTDIAVVMNTLLAATATTGATFYFKPGTYPCNSATQETTGGYSLYYCIGIPSSGSGSNYPQFSFIGEAAAMGSQNMPAGSGVIINVTTAAESSAGAGHTLTAFWERPNTNFNANYPFGNIYWGDHLNFENMSIQFPNNQRGNEYAIDVLEASYLGMVNLQFGFVTTPTAVAATNLEAVVSPATPTDGGYWRNLLAGPGWETGYSINAEGTAIDYVAAFRATNTIKIGEYQGRNLGTIFGGSVWRTIGCYDDIHCIVAGTHIASNVQLDILGLGIEYITTGPWAFVDGFTTGSALGGIITWTNTQTNVGIGSLTTPFPSGSGAKYAVEATGSWTLPSINANTISASGLGSSTTPICTTTGGQLTNSGCNSGTYTGSAPINISGTVISCPTCGTSTAALTQIAQTVVGTATSSITFSGIPGTYTNLRVVINGQSSSGSSDNLVMQFNGDTTGSHYSSASVFGTGSTPGSNTNTTTLEAAFFGSSSGTSNPTSVETIIPSYAATVFNKSATSSYVVGLVSGAFGGYWASTAAITSVKFFLGSGSNFVTGTTATLYGMQ